jgi:4-amino-4-deoxy-L-arabinose transferase-like glycosyltransferase
MKLRPAILVFVVALAVRGVVVFSLLPHLKPDQNPDYYRELGRNLSLGKGFVAAAPDGRELPNINRPPGYPVFLAGLILVAGDRLGVLLVANCLLAAIACALTVLLASRWLGSGGALIAGFLTAVEPNSVLRCCLVLTEPLFMLFLLAGLCLLVWRREKNYAWLLCGLLWGLATLCRAVAMWLPLVALAAALLWRMRPRYIVFFLIGFLPLVGLWIGRNALLTGHLFFSSSGRNVMVTGWAASLEAERTGISVDLARERLLERTGSIEFFDGRERFEKTQQEQAKVLQETLGAAPWRLAVEMVWGTGQTLVGPGGRMLEAFLREPKPAPRWWQISYTGMLLILVASAVWGAVRRGRELAFLTILVVYFVALSVGPFGNSRFRYPIIPLLAILAVAAYTKTSKDPVDATEPLHHRH